MKKSISVLALAVLLAAPSVYAQEGIGIGWDNGVSVKIPFAPVSLQVTGSFDSSIPEDDDLDTVTDAEIAAYVSYPFLDIRDSQLGVFGGFGLRPSTDDITVGGTSYDKELGYLIRFGLEPQTMVTDNIGLSGKLGLEIGIDPGYDGLDDSGATDVGAWGSVGVHWYFQ